ncbi:chemotaxis protein CheW [Xinfangfangia sp. D13-10-4-6]|uniref:chemotaxis protein CheW n=1 Tax=Pseudogemmobacter hezensis TaxID=2737662 RepID=UPI0015539479|nr:chemotaxis protein CheW [Pseudogemmobacter hezensis]NPD16187.1 chemotaxis protein CheW [Pseudogemmobacter hezensis]
MPSTDAAARQDAEFVTFFAGAQSFSLDISHVREIRRWSTVTPLPHAPKEVLGVMNLRGSVIPIYDLSARFGPGPTTDNPRNVVVVATIGSQTVGLLVEAVSEILSVAKSQIQETPDIRSENTRASITGIIQMEEGMTRVIDLEAVIQCKAKQAA